MRDVLINPIGSLEGEGEFDRGEPALQQTPRYTKDSLHGVTVFDIMSEQTQKKNHPIKTKENEKFNLKFYFEYIHIIYYVVYLYLHCSSEEYGTPHGIQSM